MTEAEINVAIHEARGLRPICKGWWAWKDGPEGGSGCCKANTQEQVDAWLANLPEGSWAKKHQPRELFRYPDYANDLNAMHEAEKVILKDGPDSDIYMDYLMAVVIAAPAGLSNHATARQRAEAFLRKIKKWKESK
ncbi:hypothetical protein EBZ39_02875 [bacterium]|nr:hypothetical protein [bacterium]